MRKTAADRSQRASTTVARARAAGGYTLGEEIANSITHGVGLVASIIGAAVPTLIVVPHHDPLWLAADAAYAGTLNVLYVHRRSTAPTVVRPRGTFTNDSG